MTKTLSRCGVAWIMMSMLGFGLGMTGVGVGCGFMAYLHLRVAFYLARMM